MQTLTGSAMALLSVAVIAVGAALVVAGKLDVGAMIGGNILAARALGLDCGPMSGFDNAKADAEFFAGTAIKSNFLCNLGYGEPTSIFQRSPRFDFA